MSKFQIDIVPNHHRMDYMIYINPELPWELTTYICDFIKNKFEGNFVRQELFIEIKNYILYFLNNLIQAGELQQDFNGAYSWVCNAEETFRIDKRTLSQNVYKLVLYKDTKFKNEYLMAATSAYFKQLRYKNGKRIYSNSRI